METGKIDIQESIRTKRLKESFSFLTTLSKLPFYVWPAFVLISICYKELKDNSYHIDLYISSIIAASILAGSILFYRFYKVYDLREVIGVNLERNRQLLRHTAKNIGWDIETDNREMMILVRPNIPFRLNQWDSGREMVILYNKNDFFINCASFGRYGLKSPFHWIGNRNSENKLLSELKKLYKDEELLTIVKSHQ